MAKVTPVRSYHATSLMSCDKRSAGGGHREDYQGGELEEDEEETEREKRGWEVKEKNCSMNRHAHLKSTMKKR